MFCYIHIPFCESRCKYCRFSTFVEKDEFKKQFYVDYLVKSINEKEEINNKQNYHPELVSGSLIQYKSSEQSIKDSEINSEGQKYDNSLNSIYFGGGTPTSLTNYQLSKILDSLQKKFIFRKDIEITLETTPNNISLENLEEWEKIGITRLSLGIQTLNDLALSEIGRIDRKGLLEKLEIIKNFVISSKVEKSVGELNNENIKCKINSKEQIPPLQSELQQDDNFNISLDFIIGLPYVNKGEILENIKYVLENYTFVKHISLYMLEDYYDYPKTWEEYSINEEDFFEEYINCKNYLQEKGFYRYELSNFSKKGFECKHNKSYWNHGDVIAFGLGAHGYIGGLRYAYPNTFNSYYSGDFEYNEKLGEDDIFLEKVMFGLRTGGIDINIYKKLNTKKIKEFVDYGMLNINENKLFLNDKGVVLLDYIIKEIII